MTVPIKNLRKAVRKQIRSMKRKALMNIIGGAVQTPSTFIEDPAYVDDGFDPDYIDPRYPYIDPRHPLLVHNARRRLQTAETMADMYTGLDDDELQSFMDIDPATNEYAQIAAREMLRRQRNRAERLYTQAVLAQPTHTQPRRVRQRRS